MPGTTGTTSATTKSKTRKVGAKPIPTTPAQAISMATALGQRCRITVPCGFRRKALDGRRTATVAGCGSRITDGRGFRTSRGAGRPITTAAGSSTAEAGSGGQGLSITILSTIRFGRLRTSPFSVGAVADGASEWALASGTALQALDGCRAGRAIGITRGGDVGAVTIASTTSAMVFETPAPLTVPRR